jgi:hypothetical protein
MWARSPNEQPKDIAQTVQELRSRARKPIRRADIKPKGGVVNQEERLRTGKGKKRHRQRRSDVSGVDRERAKQRAMAGRVLLRSGLKFFFFHDVVRVKFAFLGYHQGGAS